PGRAINAGGRLRFPGTERKKPAGGEAGRRRTEPVRKPGLAIGRWFMRRARRESRMRFSTAKTVPPAWRRPFTFDRKAPSARGHIYAADAGWMFFSLFRSLQIEFCSQAFLIS